MRGNQQATQAKAAAELERAARELADVISRDLEANQATGVLVCLTDTQQILGEICASLAAWHGRAAGQRPLNDGFHTRGEYSAWTHAELALREAVQNVANVAAALVRARHASEEAQWIHQEIEDDDEPS